MADQDPEIKQKAAEYSKEIARDQKREEIKAEIKEDAILSRDLFMDVWKRMHDLEAAGVAPFEKRQIFKRLYNQITFEEYMPEMRKELQKARAFSEEEVAEIEAFLLQLSWRSPGHPITVNGSDLTHHAESIALTSALLF